jgi:hypothetical protein
MRLDSTTNSVMTILTIVTGPAAVTLRWGSTGFSAELSRGRACTACSPELPHFSIICCYRGITARSACQNKQAPTGRREFPPAAQQTLACSDRLTLRAQPETAECSIRSEPCRCRQRKSARHEPSGTAGSCTPSGPCHRLRAFSRCCHFSRFSPIFRPDSVRAYKI